MLEKHDKKVYIMVRRFEEEMLIKTTTPLKSFCKYIYFQKHHTSRLYYSRAILNMNGSNMHTMKRSWLRIKELKPQLSLKLYLTMNSGCVGLKVYYVVSKIIPCPFLAFYYNGAGVKKNLTFTPAPSYFTEIFLKKKVSAGPFLYSSLICTIENMRTSSICNITSKICYIGQTVLFICHFLARHSMFTPKN